jgi:metacaspase-1
MLPRLSRRRLFDLRLKRLSGTMALPLTEAQTRKATRWLAAHFGDSMRRAIVGTPFGLDLICGIACKETASMWLGFVDRGLTPGDILGRAIGDASGDFPNTSRLAFPSDTPTFRREFGDEFADMLIAEANASRSLRNMGPKPWVYKGYGIFQYDLQHVRDDTAFFRDKQWYALDECLERVVGELQRKFQRTGELWAAVKAYNGSGPRADAYRDDVKVLAGWAKEELESLAPPAINTREFMAKTKPAKSRGRKAGSRKTTRRVAKPRDFRALSLHVGLNAVDPKHYAGWSGDLMACEFDAKDMAALARAQKIKPTVLLTKQATRANVFKAVRAAAKTLGDGDLLFLSYSGHGGQIPDVSGDEPDKKDETWCLYDGELIDDEVFNELSNFAAGVRIIVLSDSCHSGSVVRARIPETVAGSGRSKMMPPSVAMRTYTQNQDFYDKLQKQATNQAGRGSRNADPDAALAQLHATGSNRLSGIAGKVKASVILISGCQDNQTSLDGDHNGAFTEQLLRVWDSGRFNPEHGTYVNFHATIKAGMPASQTPNLFTLGAVATFSKQRPFTI